MKKAQLKIQEMAFVLVAIMIFLALVALFYLSVRTSQLQTNTEQIKDDQARNFVRKLTGVPEFQWAGCPSCIDADKAFLVKERIRVNASTVSAWGLDYLALEVVYPPRSGGECTSANYPACNLTTVIRGNGSYGTASSVYVALCTREYNFGYIKCDLGRLYASGREVRR